MACAGNHCGVKPAYPAVSLVQEEGYRPRSVAEGDGLGCCAVAAEAEGDGRAGVAEAELAVADGAEPAVDSDDPLHPAKPIPAANAMAGVAMSLIFICPTPEEICSS